MSYRPALLFTSNVCLGKISIQEQQESESLVFAFIMGTDDDHILLKKIYTFILMTIIFFKRFIRALYTEFKQI